MKNRDDKKAKKLSACILLFIFILSIMCGYFGLQGVKMYDSTSFHEESAFSNIAKAVPMVQKTYDYISSNIAFDIDDKLYEALEHSYKNLKSKNPSQEIDENMQGIENKKEYMLKSLIFINAIDPPKLKENEKREIKSYGKDIFTYVMDNMLYNKALPEKLESIFGKFEDGERVNALLYSLMLDAPSIDAELTKNLKKSIRQPQSKITASKWTSTGEINQFTAVIASNGKTLVLISILLIVNFLILIINCIKSKNWYLDGKWVLILAIVDFLIVFMVLPMIYLLVKSIYPNGEFSLETFKRLYSYSLNHDAMKNTLIVSFFTMVLGTLIAFPLAWLIGRTDIYFKKFFRSLFVITYMVPPYVGAMAWLRLLNPNAGTMNVVLRTIVGSGADTGPINIYSIGGLIWVLTCFYYPYAFITISRAMEKMDPSLEEASKISGANPIVTIMRITLPMMIPSLVAGALLVFIGAASAYGIPSIIGSPGKVHTVTTRIVEYLGLGTQGLNDATGMAVFLMILSILILYVSDVFIAKKQFVTISGKSMRPSIVELGKWKKPLTALVIVFSIFVVFIPFITILTTSFKFDLGKSLTAPGNFTLNQWKEIFTRDETLHSLKNSILFGTLASTIGIIVAITMSYLLQRTRMSGRKIPDFLITLGSSTPSVVIALGLIMTMKGNFGINIYNTPTIIVVAYLIKYLMMGMRTVISSMSQVHPSLEECSQISGASWFRTMIKITGPLIFPSIAAGWFLIFIPSFYELSMTTLLYSNQTKTIGYQLYEYWTYHSQPQACAMAFGILIIVIALNFVLNKITKGEFSI